MRIEASPATHLTYCTNVHAAESLEEVRSVLAGPVLAVKERVSPTAPFGVGLRLSARAAVELEHPEELARLAGQLSDAGLYAFTLNGFPYGQFHSARVKERVYRPDWLESERVEYTRSLSRALAVLLPDGMVGSISTVPGCFKPRAAGAATMRAMALNVATAAAELVRIERDTGKHLALALEPEPFCAFETTRETIDFFQQALADEAVTSLFARRCGIAQARAEEELRRYVGVCLDACHAAVEFESPLEALRALTGAGISVPKIQVSAGLVVRELGRHAASLSSFADETYLHQVVARTPSGFQRYLDLPEAIERAPLLPSDTEWRVHFHVPVFRALLEPFSTTQSVLTELLEAPETLQTVPHLEVETYTFGLLPERYRNEPVVNTIARELDWTREALARSLSPGAE